VLRRRFLVGAGCAVTLGAPAAAPSALEQSRIDKLLRFIETRQGVAFIRNDIEYNCADAATFLRRKLESMAAQVGTAREFIERVGTRSGTSGRPYQVKFADGRLMPASQFLGEELRRLEAQAS
jgi:Family of unknown function (DUF5329)